MFRQPKQKRKLHRRPGKRLGATLVEFAVVAPILFFLFVMFVEFGRYIVTLHALEEAARVACRMAVLEESTTEEVEQEATAILETFGINKYETTITPSLFTAAPAGEPVSVTIDVDYKDVSWLPAPRFLRNKSLSVTNTTPKEK